MKITSIRDATLEMLHHPENPEHLAVFAQEALARLSKRLGIAGGNECMRRLDHVAITGHCAINALAQRRCHHPDGIISNDDVTLIVLFAQRLEREWHALATDGSQRSRLVCVRNRSAESRNANPLFALPTPTLAVSPCGKIQA